MFVTKILIYPRFLDQIKKSINLIDGFIIGINGLSVNTSLNINKEEIDTYLSLGKEVFVSLNKNMFNDDLENLKETLVYLNNKNIKGVLFYDLSILNLVKKLKLNIPLVWSQEHLTNNYLTCNYYAEKGVEFVNISGEITLKEILEIRKNTDLKLIVPIFGYLPMFNSKRHIVNNYLDTFNLEKNSKIYYMYKEGKKYPIIDNELGTTAYSSQILDGYEELNILKDNNIDYVTLNSFNIEDDKFIKVLKIYNGEKNNIDDLFSNLDKGFLYKETIYRVKKDEKGSN